jgi:hypothetical protein
MTRKSFRKTVISVIAVMTVALVIFGFAAVNKVNAVSIQPPLSIWIDPPVLNLTTTNTHVGDKFNVTVWINDANDTFSVAVFNWQVTVGFNTTWLTWTRAGYTGTGKSQFFANLTTIPVSPVLTVNNEVQFGESLFSGGVVGNGTLCWIEFQITMAPNETTGTLTSPLEFHGAPSSDTFVLTEDVNTVSSLVVYNATVNYSLPPPDDVPPTIENVQRTPSGDVSENQSVTVTADITDNAGGSGVANATLSYSTDNMTWTDAAMTQNGNTWSGDVPGQLNGTRVWYKITAFDNAGNNATKYETDMTPYYYDVVPEFASAVLIIMMVALTATMIACRKRFIRLP